MQLSQSILLAIFLASASSAIAAPAGPSDTTALAERSVDTEEIVELVARSPSPRGRGGGRSGSRSGSRGRGAFRAAGKAFRFAAQQAGGGNEERSLEEDEVMELAARSPSPEPRGRGGFGGRGGGRGRSGSRGRGGFRKFRQAAQQQQSNEERSLEEDDVMELAARDFDDEEVMELAARSPSPRGRGGGRSGSRSGSRGRGAFRAAGKAFRFAAQQAGGGNEERSLEEDEVMELAARDFDDEEVMDLAARSPSPRGRGGFGGRGGGRGRSGSRRGGFRKFRQAAQQQQSNEERSLEEDEVMELAARDFDDEEVMDLAARSPSPEPEPRGRGGFGGRGGGRGRSGSRRGGFRKFRQAAQQQQSNEERSIDELD